MVHPCSVEGCRNKTKDGIFRFPRDAGLRLQWIESLNLDPATVNDTTRVCGAHFCEDDFQRDLKGELLGVPSKRKILTPEAVPTVEKHNAVEEINLRNKSYKNANGDYKIPKSWGSPYASTFASASMVTGKKPTQRRKKTTTVAPTSATKKFVRDKEKILKRIKEEAAMNVMRDKMSGATNFEMLLEDEDAEEPLEVKPGSSRIPSAQLADSFHPNQCVILQPIGQEDDVPVIIPGDPKHIQKTLLKDKKVQQFIEMQVAENRDAVAASEASAIVLNTFSKQTDLNRPCRVQKVPISGLQKQCLEETKAKLPLPPELSHLDQSSEIDETDIESAEILIKKGPIDPSVPAETEFRHSIFD